MNSTIIFNPRLDEKVREVEEEFQRSASEVLSGALNREVKVTLKEILPFDFRAIKADCPKNAVFVTIQFKDGFEGTVLFLIEVESAAYLADLVMMGDGGATFESDEHLDAVQEMINQIMGDYGRALSTIFDRKISFENSKAVVLDLSPSDFQDSNWVWVRFEVDAGQKVEMSKLVSWSAIHEYLPDSENGVEEIISAPEAGKPMIPEIMESSDQGELEILMDIDLPITIELGRTRMMIKNILKLGPGSIVELNKLSGEPVDLYVNNKKFAEGEVVVVDENFGVRITEIVRVDERLKNLEG
jgi:flagellar motor switch protein FliN/FliY